MEKILNKWHSEVKSFVKLEPDSARIYDGYTKFSIEEIFAFYLIEQLDKSYFKTNEWHKIFIDIYKKDKGIIISGLCDLYAVKERDPACLYFTQPLLFFKGFQALQLFRIANYLWYNKNKNLALYIQSLISRNLCVDIHPAVKIGKGVFIDHASAIVIGQTCVVGDNVSIMQNVTLGGNGKENGDRHPKIGDWVLLSCGAKVLGNISIGKSSCVAAGSVVLDDVPEGMTVAGIPAKIVGKGRHQNQCVTMFVRKNYE